MLHTIGPQSGVSLMRRTFEPASAALAAVVVPSAMGVTRNFYARFAEWRAATSPRRSTIAASASRRRRRCGFQVDIRDWATQDCGLLVPQWLAAR
jgi:predicted alpha/beta hydrolase